MTEAGPTLTAMRARLAMALALLLPTAALAETDGAAADIVVTD